MNSKKQNYDETAKKIIEFVGGKENISFFTHCMTRLRFNLKDESLFQKEKMEELPEVLGIVVQNGQFQIIIGEVVPEIYSTICTLAGIGEEKGLNINLDETENKKKRLGFGSILEVISGSFAPIVTAFAGAGVLKGLLTLLTNYGLMSTDTGLYLILNSAADSVFYFLPFLLAYSSAEKFKTNKVLALVLAGIYMHPTIIENAGNQNNLFGFSFYLVKYSATVIPILLSVWIMSYLYKWLTNHVPGFLRIVVVPLVVILVMAPINLVVIGPLGYNIGLYLGKFIQALFDFSPLIGGFIYGATHQLIVFTGTHMALTPIKIGNIETLGYDVLGPVTAMTVMAVAGMCFGIFLKAKNEQNKTLAFSSFISSFIGITEPALYGVAFRFKKPLIAVCLGGAVSGAFVSVLGAKAISFGMPSIISLPVYAGTIPIMLAGFAIAFVVSAIIAYIIGFDEEKDLMNK